MWAMAAGHQAPKASRASLAAETELCGFWPVTNFPSLTAFAVQGSATSTVAPNSLSFASTKKGTLSVKLTWPSSKSEKTETVFPFTKGSPSLPLALTKHMGPWHTAATTFSAAEAFETKSPTASVGKSTHVPWPPAKKQMSNDVGSWSANFGVPFSGLQSCSIMRLSFSVLKLSLKDPASMGMSPPPMEHTVTSKPASAKVK
mmetsp:Transcript_116637/g.336886  ORF Transcript_116637/g.336886 Transcript_116637/m.336886 type:complete len:202 (+) Transcript_116637:135-740(+)